MTSVSKNVYIGKLEDIVNKYKNICQSIIKMKSADVKSNTYIDSGKRINDKYPKFKNGDIVRASSYKNIFAKRYTPNWSEEASVIKKVKNTVPSIYVINDLNGKEIVGKFYENKLKQKHIKFEFKIEKVIKRKDNKLCLKWKEYNNLFNIWIDQKDTV